MLHTPFSLMHPTTKKRLVDLINKALSDAFILDSSLRLSLKLPIVRAASVIPRSCQLCPFATTLANALESRGLPVEEGALADLCGATANAVIQRRLFLPPPIDQTGLKLVTWNVTALSPLENSYKNKLIAKLASNRVVCLQETKMTTEDARLLELQLPGCKVIATPAVLLERANNENDPPSGK